MATAPENNEAIEIPDLNEIEGDNDILGTFANCFGVTKHELEEQSRKQKIVGIRMTIMYLLREYGGMSFPSIGKMIGDRDHTTVIHAYNKIKGQIADHPSLAQTLTNPIELAKAIKLRKLNIENEIKRMNTKLYAEAMANILSANLSTQKFQVRKIPERNLKILELYREGITLQNMALVFGLSRERIRQIVTRTIHSLAVNESINKGIVMDIGIMMEEETKNRKTVIDSLKPIKTTPKRENRWSRYYDTCRSCGSSVYKHVARGLCESCIGSFRGNRREKIFETHLNKCDTCDISRQKAIQTYGSDLYIKKDKTVLCRKCFLQTTGQGLGSYKNFEWSRFHPSCIKCGTSTIPHARRGLCKNCDKTLTREDREQLILSHGSKCDRCPLTRDQSMQKFRSDLNVTKTKMVLCQNCLNKK